MGSRVSAALGLFLPKSISRNGKALPNLEGRPKIINCPIHKRPIIPLYSRAYVLDNLKAVDFVVPFDEETPIELIKIIKPDVHVKGGDYKEEDLPEAEIVKSYGGEIKIIPLIEGFSTTKIIEWVLEKYK